MHVNVPSWDTWTLLLPSSCRWTCGAAHCSTGLAPHAESYADVTKIDSLLPDRSTVGCWMLEASCLNSAINPSNFGHHPRLSEAKSMCGMVRWQKSDLRGVGFRWS